MTTKMTTRVWVEDMNVVGNVNVRQGALGSFGDVCRSRCRAQAARTHTPSRSFPGRVESQQKIPQSGQRMKIEILNRHPSSD